MATEGRKYCEDCRFFAPGHGGNVYGRCGAPGALIPKLDGLQYVAREFDGAPYASAMRITQCGPDGKWFEVQADGKEAA